MGCRCCRPQTIITPIIKPPIIKPPDELVRRVGNALLKFFGSETTTNICCYVTLPSMSRESQSSDHDEGGASNLHAKPDMVMRVLNKASSIIPTSEFDKLIIQSDQPLNIALYVLSHDNKMIFVYLTFNQVDCFVLSSPYYTGEPGYLPCSFTENIFTNIHDVDLDEAIKHMFIFNDHPLIDFMWDKYDDSDQDFKICKNLKERRVYWDSTGTAAAQIVKLSSNQATAIKVRLSET